MELLDNLKKKQDEEFDEKFIGVAEKDGNVIRFHGGIDPVIAIEIKEFIDQVRSETAEAVEKKTAEKILNLLFPSENENDIRARKIYMESFNSLKE